MIDIQQLIDFDKELLLTLNGSHSLFWDGVMWVVTSTATWIPAILMLLYVIFKNNKPTQALLIVGMIALTVTLADQLSSSICKPFFARFRPTQDPEIMYLVHTVNGYRGGLYGFISGHATNTFAVAMFVSLLIRNKCFTWMMFVWAAIPSYSRIYLGVHYPGDILCGAICGCCISLLTYWLYSFLQRKLFINNRYMSTPSYATDKKTYGSEDVNLLHLVLLLTYIYALVMGMIKAKVLDF
nr:phosphatase PAP2 family protein [Bacteroides caecicola]